MDQFTQPVFPQILVFISGLPNVPYINFISFRLVYRERAWPLRSGMVPPLRKGKPFLVRHCPSIGKGHGFLSQVWSFHRERAWFISSGFVFVNYPVFHGYLFIHCLGSHHVWCLSGIVCAHMLCSILDFCGLFAHYIFYLSPWLQGNLFLFHKKKIFCDNT